MRTLLLPLVLLFFAFQTIAQNKVEPIVQFGHGNKTISEMAFSPDGTMLATTDNQILKLWDMASGLEFRAFAAEPGFWGYITNISFTPDNQQIVYQSNLKIYFRSIVDGAIQKELELVLPEGKDAEEEKEPKDEDIQALLDAEKYKGITFSKDGSLMLLGTDAKLEINRYPSNQLIRKINIKKGDESTDEFSRMVMASRGTPLVISSDNQHVFYFGKVYGVNDGREKFNPIKNKENYQLSAGKFSPDGKTLVFGGLIIDTTGTHDNFLKLMEQYSGSTEGETLFAYDVQSGTPLYSIRENGVFNVNFSPDGSKFITGHKDHTLKVWETKTGKMLYKLQVAEVKEVAADNWLAKLQAKAPVGAAIFTLDGKGIIARGDTKKSESLMIWEYGTGKVIRNLGANIPPIRLEGQPSLKDSIILREFEEVEQIMGMTQKNYKGFRLLDLTTGRVPHAYARYDSIVFSPLGNRYCLKKETGALEIYESDLGLRLTALENSHNGFLRIVFNENGTLIAAAEHNTFCVWDAKTGDRIWRNQEHEENINFLEFDADGEIIVSASKKERKAIFWSLESQNKLHEVKQFYIKGTDEFLQGASEVASFFGKAKRGLKSFNPLNKDSEETETGAERIVKIGKLINSKGYYDVDFSPDGKIAAVWPENLYSVKFVEVKGGKKLRTLRDVSSMVIQKLVLGMMDKDQFEKDIEEMDEGDKEQFMMPDNMGELLYQQLKEQYNLRNFVAISPGFKYFAKATKSYGKKKDNSIQILAVVKEKGRKKKLKLEDSAKYQEGLTFSPNGKSIAASSLSNNNIRIWNAETGNLITTLEGHSGKIAFGPRGKTLISSGWDRQVKVWDIEQNQPIYTFIGIQGTNDYIILLPSGYYSTSRRNSKAVAFRKGKDVYPFDQFDIQFQRQDKVLRTIAQNRIGFSELATDECLADAYEQAYRKRLETYDLTEDDFDKELHLPEITVTGIPVASKSKNIQFQINAKDSQYPLDWLNVYVNDVPLFGKAGKDLRSRKSKSFNGTVPLILSNGENKIQISVINSTGVESIKTTHQITYTGIAAKPNLYLITLGASDFKNGEQQTLPYSESDLTAITQLFSENKKSEYGQIHQKQLQGSNFTLANIAQIESLLTEAKVDDKVLIFVATHGVLDAQYNYYLATYDMDFGNPKQAGLSYARLEELLDKTPSRNKMLFIDACYSNELDSSKNEIAPITTNCLAGESYFDLMKSLFVDLRRGTGATIIASARGVEQAQEGTKWNSSVFTHALLEGLSEGNANLNYDDQNKITVSELQVYLAKRVKQLTNGKQRPTYRIENIHNDFQVW